LENEQETVLQTEAIFIANMVKEAATAAEVNPGGGMIGYWYQVAEGSKQQ